MRLCWDSDEARARETLHRVWPNQGLSGQVVQDLPTWTHFEQATSMLTVEQTVGPVPCGPDVAAVIDQAQAFLERPSSTGVPDESTTSSTEPGGGSLSDDSSSTSVPGAQPGRPQLDGEPDPVAPG